MVLLNRLRWRASATVLAMAAGATLVLALSATHARADEAADALKSLKGTWVTDEGIESTWTFEGETVKATVNGLEYSCKVKLDPKAKPATIDFVIDEGPEDSKGKTSKCIYKLDGEKLILCVAMPGKDRPKEFEQNEGESYVFELKKEKAKEKVEKK